MQPGVVEALERAMGPQLIRVTGIPDTSHFARVLVASDYRMKRYAMELDKSPVPGLPSFVGLLKSKKGALNNMLPRWWLACNYEPLAKSQDGLAFELRGPGVKVMTEDDFVDNGEVKRSGKGNAVAQQWADALTAKYSALAAKDPVFGELRNVMDLCVIAALVQREDLLARVNLQLPNILSETEGAELAKFNAPKQVSARCSVTKSGRDYIITASGGVDIDSLVGGGKCQERRSRGRCGGEGRRKRSQGLVVELNHRGNFESAKGLRRWSCRPFSLRLVPRQYIDSGKPASRKPAAGDRRIVFAGSIARQQGSNCRRNCRPIPAMSVPPAAGTISA